MTVERISTVSHPVEGGARMPLPSLASLGLGNLSRCTTGTRHGDGEVSEIDKCTFDNNVNRSKRARETNGSDNEGDPLEAIAGTVKKDDDEDYYYVVADDESENTGRWVFDNEVVHNDYPGLSTMVYVYVGLKNDDSTSGDLRIFKNEPHNNPDISLTGYEFKDGDKVTFVPVETSRLKTNAQDTIIKIKRDADSKYETNWAIPPTAKGVACRIERTV